MFDTHAHLNFKAFKNDYSKVISRSLDSGMKILNVGSQCETSCCAVKIAQEFEDKSIYASIGLHPIHVRDEDFDYDKYKKLAQSSNKVVAVGETGFDYYRVYVGTGHCPVPTLTGHCPVPTLTGHCPVPTLTGQCPVPTFRAQKELFLQHLKLAQELNKPLILHCRGSRENPEDAYEDLLEVLNSEIANNNGVARLRSQRRLAPSRVSAGSAESRYSASFRAVIHCFSSNWNIAQKFLKLGFYIGFTGVITFKNTEPSLLEVVKKTPLDKILIETDAPYLAPEPYRGKSRNEPLHVKYVAEKIAEIKGLELQEVIEKTQQNGEELFLK